MILKPITTKVVDISHYKIPLKELPIKNLKPLLSLKNITGKPIAEDFFKSH